MMKRFASCAGWIVLAVASSGVAGSQVSSPVQNGEGSFVAVEGSKLYFEECGSGRPTVVLLHDGVVDSAVWDEVWPAFCKQFHTIRYDRRGYGRSPAATAWYSEIDDLAALLHHLSVSSAVLVGSSHGGGLAIDFALAHPDAVQQLVLIGPAVSGLPFTKQFLDRGKHAFEIARKGDVQDGIAEWSKDPYLIAAQNEAARKHLFDLLTANPQDMTHADYPLANKPALPRLHEIRVPTLILVGDADIPDVHAHAGAIEAGIPNARRVIVEGTGHLMYLEKPDEVSRLVISFIRQNMF